MYHEYPYTTYFHDIDKMCACLRQIGYRLEVDANALKLIDSKGNVISTVTISYAEKALTDVDGTAIKSYLLNASTGETTLVLTKGNGQATVLTIPFATKAEKDVLGKDLTAYAYALSVVGDKLAITRGDGTTYEVTVPFATKASTDTNGKDIKTYAATLAVDGTNLVLKDSENRELARLTAPYATSALNDADGDEIASTYAATLEAGATNVTLKAKDGSTLSTITVPFATKAATDQQGNSFLSDYAEKIVIDGDGKRIGLEAHDGTRLATITVPFATEATNATNAVQSVAIQGDQIVFTTYGGQSFTITSPYSVKAQKDDAGNTIKTTYVARVENNASTGAIEFYDATGTLITSLTPTVTAATTDNYGNNIADYIKQIVASASSDYVTVTHGDGTVDTITINYATKAWKDTNNNVIKNTYIKRLACVEDVQDNHYKLVAYNGDTPEAELFRIELVAYMAQRAIGDENGINISQKNAAQDQRMSDIENSIANIKLTKLYNGSTLIEEASLGDHLEYDSTTNKINVVDTFKMYNESQVAITKSAEIDTYSTPYRYYTSDFPSFTVGNYYRFRTYGTLIHAYDIVPFVDDRTNPTTTVNIDCSDINEDLGNVIFKVTAINGGTVTAIGYKDWPTEKEYYDELGIGEMIEVEDGKIRADIPSPTQNTFNYVLRPKYVSGKYKYVLDRNEYIYSGTCNFTDDPNTSSDIVWNNDTPALSDLYLEARNYLLQVNNAPPVCLSINCDLNDQYQRVMLRPQYIFSDPNTYISMVYFSGIVYDWNGVATLYGIQLMNGASSVQMTKTTLTHS